jgi:hypothetical protein
MPVLAHQDPLKRTIDAALSVATGKDDPIADKIAEVIIQAYQGAPPDEWDDVVSRFQLAYEVDDTELAARFGISVLPPVKVTRVVREPLELLVRGGWFERYLEWTRDHESPAQFHFGAAVAAISAVLGRRPRIAWEARVTYANLFVLLVGPTGSRKGSAIDRAVRLISSAVPARDLHVLPSEGTHQGFAHRLRLRHSDPLNSRGWSDGLIIAPEFSVLISRDQNKSDLVKWFTDWYDSPDVWERALRGEEDFRLENVCVSVLGGSNIEWLRTMPKDSVTGGFMPRFLIFDAEDKRSWIARPKFDLVTEGNLIDSLRTNLSELADTMDFTPEACEYLDHWYEVELKAQYEATSDEKIRAWLARKQAAAMKLAVVWQLTDGGDRAHVTMEYLKKARGIVDWGDHAVVSVYGALGVTPEGEVSEAVLLYVDRNGGRAPMKGIIRAFRGAFSRTRIKEACATLQAAGILRLDANPIEGPCWVRVGV